jgi:hypothetical protein
MLFKIRETICRNAWVAHDDTSFRKHYTLEGDTRQRAARLR